MITLLAGDVVLVQPPGKQSAVARMVAAWLMAEGRATAGSGSGEAADGAGGDLSGSGKKNQEVERTEK
jgi:hypothetical protein